MVNLTRRLAPGDMVRIRTERWRVTAHVPFGTCAFVDVAGADTSNSGRRARFLAPFENIDPVVVDRHPLVVRPPRWRRIACARLADAAPSPTSLRAAARADITLMPFQLEPALAITHGLTSRLLIADAVGLGKTVQAGLIVAEVLARAGDGHALIVTPPGLREQWLRELRCRFAVDAGIVDATTTAVADRFANPWLMHAAVIASIDYIKRPDVLRGLEDMVWDAVVFDEAHWLSGHSDRAKAAAEIAARGRVVVALTATPHSGNEDAFVRLCDLGRLAGEGPVALFRRTRRDTGLAEMRRMRWLTLTPTTVERRMHDALASYAGAVWKANLSGGARLAMIVLARRACSSAHALVRSLERRLELLATNVEPSLQFPLPFEPFDSDDEPAGELACPGLDDAARERRNLEEVIRLARLAAQSESKLNRIERLLARTREPAIVFTEYRDTLEHLAAALGRHAPTQLHGGMTQSERRECVRRFTSGSARVLLATDAGSEGLNLHHRCRLVINLEVPWTPLRLEQRIGRVDRIGQEQRVHAVQMIAGGTPEQSVLQRLIDREWRARASLANIARIDADAIADAAIGGTTLVPPEENAAAPPMRATKVDVTGAAIQEAHRLHLVRRLRRRAGAATVHRPPVTVLSRNGTAAHAYLVYLLTLLGADDQWLWNAVVGTAHSIPLQRVHSAACVREITTAVSNSSAEIVALAAADTIERFLAAIHVPTATASARETAIRNGIAVRRSTMAAALVQRGLFDDREERRASAAATRLNAALDRCATRLATLQRIDAVHASTPQLAFAVLTR